MEDYYAFLTTTTTIASTASAAPTPLDNEDADYIKLFSANSCIVLRFLLVISIGIISIWANHEASKGFGITIINDAKDSPAGKRFNLLYISNDKAARIVLNTSYFVENLLYPNTNQIKKQVQHLTLRLANNSVPNKVTVDSNANNEFVINISPSILMEDYHTKNLDHTITSVVLQGMARVWVWNPEYSSAPRWLLDGVVEYIDGLAGFGHIRNFGTEFGYFCLRDEEDPATEVVTRFLDCRGRHQKGFIQQLNQALMDGWDNPKVEDVLGMSAENLCNSCKNSSHGSI